LRRFKVLVVDDSPVARAAVRRALEGEFEVFEARSGKEGLELFARVSPDVVVLDLILPDAFGLELLPELKRAPVLVFSSLAAEGAEVTLKALEAGAADYLLKPSNLAELVALKRELLEKVRALVTRPRSRKRRPKAGEGFAALLIGASTGGPPAVAEVLKGLKPRVPVVCAVHLLPGFGSALAKALERRTGLPARVVKGAEDLEPGVAYVLEENYEFSSPERLVPSMVPSVYSPSVDILFTSAAAHLGPKALAVVLTGMGSDGALGAKAIHEAGGTVLVQDPETAPLWGMPRSAEPYADGVLDLEEIREFLRGALE